MTRLLEVPPVKWRRQHKLFHRGARRRRAPKPRVDRIGDFFTWFRSVANHSSDTMFRYGKNGYQASPRRLDSGALCIFYHKGLEFACVKIENRIARESTSKPVIYIFDDIQFKWRFKIVSREQLADFLAAISIGAGLARVVKTINMRHAEEAFGLPR